LRGKSGILISFDIKKSGEHILEISSWCFTFYFETFIFFIGHFGIFCLTFFWINQFWSLVYISLNEIFPPNHAEIFYYMTFLIIFDRQAKLCLLKIDSILTNNIF
jgi:polyferredoxin